ncbi:MAG: metallophosphoesterase [Gemmatimonadota bacterium]
MPRTFVLGDVHGAARALEQVFERSGLDPHRDRLISLGDLCDRKPEVDRCFDLLLEVEDLTVVLGNHDEWTADWMVNRAVQGWWFEFGGAETVASISEKSVAVMASGSTSTPAATARIVPTTSSRAASFTTKPDTPRLMNSTMSSAAGRRSITIRWTSGKYSMIC